MPVTASAAAIQYKFIRTCGYHYSQNDDINSLRTFILENISADALVFKINRDSEMVVQVFEVRQSCSALGRGTVADASLSNTVRQSYKTR